MFKKAKILKFEQTADAGPVAKGAPAGHTETREADSIPIATVMEKRAPTGCAPIAGKRAPTGCAETDDARDELFRIAARIKARQRKSIAETLKSASDIAAAKRLLASDGNFRTWLRSEAIAVNVAIRLLRLHDVFGGLERIENRATLEALNAIVRTSVSEPLKTAAREAIDAATPRRPLTLKQAKRLIAEVQPKPKVTKRTTIKGEGFTVAIHGDQIAAIREAIATLQKRLNATERKAA